MRKFNLVIADEDYEELEELATRQNKSMAEVIRDSLGILKWIVDEQSKGHRILIDRDGECREIIFRSLLKST